MRGIRCDRDANEWAVQRNDRIDRSDADHSSGWRYLARVPGAVTMPKTPTNRERLLNRGLTLIEVLIASVILGLLAGGTLMVFVTAVRISKATGVNQQTIFSAQQTIERYRNKIACRQGGEGATDAWYDGPTADCLPNPPGGSQVDAVTGATYQVSPVDCAGTLGDCLQVTVTQS